MYPLARPTGTQTHRSLFFLQAHGCSQYSARTLSNRHRYMQVIRETVNAPGCVTSVFHPPPEPRSQASSSSAMPWSLPWRPNTAASNSRMLRTSAERPTASRILAADSAAGAFEGLKFRLHCLGWVRGLLKHSYVLLLGLLRLAASLRSSLEFHLDCRACKHESAQHKHYILCRSGRIRSERPRSLNPRP